MCVHIVHTLNVSSGIKIRAEYCLNSVDLFLFTESIKLIERLFHSIQPMNLQYCSPVYIHDRSL